MKSTRRFLSVTLATLMAASGTVLTGAAAEALEVNGGVVRADEISEVAIDENNFPDETFRKYVKLFDQDIDDVLSSEELGVVAIIDCSNMEISDLTGIEYFTNIQTLDCSGNQLDKIDISSNVKITDLRCSSNNLTELDVSKITHLKSIYFDDNKISSIDLSNHADLTCVRGQYNELTSINLEGDKKISTLQLPSNKLSELDISDCANLKIFECWSNQLTTLDLASTSSLTYIDCHDNQIESIDFGKNKVNIVVCYKNKMPDIDVSKFGGLSKSLDFTVEGEYLIGVDKDEDGNCYNTLYVEGLDDINYAFNAFVADFTTPISGTELKIPTPSPVPTEEVTPEPTPTSTPEPTPTAEPNTVEGFAERLYTTCLSRDAEADGMAFWVAELKSGMNGAEAAEAFFFSQEFKGFNLTNDEYITRLYKTFMNREPDEDGIAYWTEQMTKGMSAKEVFDGFVLSHEWADICYEFGIRSGGLVAPSYEIEASSKVVAFAERLYTTCLGRDAEEDGLNFWSQELANQRYTGTVAARAFFTSEEFVGLKLDDIQYIDRLYKTFMGRDAEAEGFDFWFRAMLGGTTRQQVFDSFATSPEFLNLCAEAGILA